MRIAYDISVFMTSEYLSDAARLAARRLIAIVESSDDAIVSKDLNGIITSWNQGAERLFGYAASEVIGKSITIIIPAERLAEEEHVLASVRRGDRVAHFETIRRRKDGTMVPISLSVSPILDEYGVVIGASKIARDISERVRAERERAQLVDALQEANRLKDEFLATLSHEIRTPLNAILGYAQLLESAQLEPQHREKAADAIARNAESLTKIIDDILDVSRITAGRLRLKIEPVHLPELVQDALSAVQLAAEAKGIRLVTEIDPAVTPVAGDAARLQQVLWNLLINAIKFTPRGGQVVVAAGPVDGGSRIVVRDTGVGIASEFLPFVFDRFRQADSRTTREFAGLGLGLAIARHLVELHGGTITASSEGPGKGSTFTVILPALTPTHA
jgi:PAS domain S-box-containing protein